MQMQADGVSRRDLLSGLAAAAVVAAPALANADTEYANIPFLGGSDQVDVNNANIRVYTRCVLWNPTRSLIPHPLAPVIPSLGMRVVGSWMYFDSYLRANPFFLLLCLTFLPSPPAPHSNWCSFPGMYPTIAGLMVKNTPYKDTADIKTKLFPKLTPAMQEIFLKYDKNLIALKPAPEFVEDIWNNGLYR
jgi:hypothetical protein